MLDIFWKGLDTYWAQISTPEGRVVLHAECAPDGNYEWAGTRATDGERAYVYAISAPTPTKALHELAASYSSEVWQLEIWNGRQQIWP